MHDPADISLAAMLFSTELYKTLIRKGILTNDEALQVWRDTMHVNMSGPSENKEGIAAVLKQTAPEGLL